MTFAGCCIFAFISSGCASTMSLNYAKLPDVEQTRGAISVIVVDERSADEIGGDTSRVGTIRNTFGMPFALRSEPDRKPPKAIKELVSDCLRASGYAVSENAVGAPLMQVALNSFWSDGYQHSRMWLKMVVELKKDSNSQPFWQRDFESNVGITWTVGYGKFDQGFTDLLEDAKQQLIKTFEDSKFRKSYISIGTK